MAEQEPDRNTVKEHIKKAFPNDWQRIIKDMKWSSLDGYWYIDYAGMHVGIEKDGYIHS